MRIEDEILRRLEEVAQGQITIREELQDIRQQLNRQDKRLAQLSGGIAVVTSHDGDHKKKLTPSSPTSLKRSYLDLPDWNE